MRPPAASPTAALELRGVTKRFGALTALDDVSVLVARGSVHAVLGENGAGKSTMMRIAYGLLRPDEGEVCLFGASERRHSVTHALRMGVGMVQQHAALVPGLTVEENLVLGARGLYRPEHAARRLRETMDASGLRIPTNVRVAALDVVDQQRLEILKALSQGARLLILDEPTAVLAPADSRELLRWVRQFADAGGTVILVTHKLREALSIADNVTVLRRGTVTETRRVADVSEAQLASAMFPDSAGDGGTPQAGLRAGEPVVAAEALFVADDRGVIRIREASFEVRKHEIVGIAAVEGSGHRELLSALAGRLQPRSGTLRTPDRRALIPADRLRDAIIPDFTLTENVALHDLGRRRGIMPWRSLVRRTSELIERFGIKAPSPRVPARSLSGGNQQRLVVARELDGEVDLVVADNPTRGLDIRSATFVREQLRAVAARAAVIVHTPDVEELLSFATRVLVVFHGSVREVPLDRDTIGRAMIGADANSAA